jgi:eukaryotic-like serine/threonine-protein kinase
VLPPETILAHRYRIVSLLGQGGMGHVYRAHHLGLGRDVALKVLLPEWAEHEMWPRFEREARTLGRLDHPGCVRVLDTGTAHSGCRYLAMELLEGPTLADELARERRLSPRRVTDVAMQLLRALAHAHAHGVVHRDVKPANVMQGCRPGGGRRLVLIDFGLALLRDDAPLTAAGITYGSPSYMAPERLLGHPADARSDVYAVGVTLYELLAGVRPFVGLSVTEIARQHLERVPLPLRGLRRDLPPSLEIAISRALSKDPERRFASAEEMLSTLEPIPLPEPERDLAANEGSTAILPRFIDSIPRRFWSWLRYGAWRWS